MQTQVLTNYNTQQSVPSSEVKHKRCEECSSVWLSRSAFKISLSLHMPMYICNEAVSVLHRNQFSGWRKSTAECGKNRTMLIGRVPLIDCRCTTASRRPILLVGFLYHIDLLARATSTLMRIIWPICVDKLKLYNAHCSPTHYDGSVLLTLIGSIRRCWLGVAIKTCRSFSRWCE